MSVREESVRLSLDDAFTSKMIRAAAATALLEKSLNNLDGTAIRSSRGTSKVTRDNDSLSNSATKGADTINQLTGRMRVLGEVAGAVGTGIIPLAAIGIPAVSGLASQFGFAAVAGGVAIGAFQGVGDALKAMNKAGLEPTKENLAKARQMMSDLSPAAQDFVIKIRTMIPELKKLRDSAATGMFPGLTEGLDSMESVLPKVERIVAAVSGELGDIGASTGASLASDRWSSFFDFLATDAPSALHDMAVAAGNTGHALAEMWMAFDPLNDDFSAWMVKATGDLDKWASGLSKTKGFEEFVSYIQQTGPQVGETLGAVANAILQIVEAAAPIGGPVLAGVEAFAKAVSAIADSDLGTPIFGAVAALSAMNLAMRTSAALSKTTFGSPVLAQIKQQALGYKGIAAAQREMAAAQQALSMAQLSRSAEAVRARNAQSALIAPEAKRGAVSEYVAAAKVQENAVKRVAAAEKARSAAVREGAASAGKAAGVVAGLAVATTGLGDKLGVTNTASLALMGTMAGPWGSAIGGGVGAVIDLAHANDGLADSLTKVSAVAGKVDFGTFNNQLSDAQKKLDDLNHTTGFKDFFSDGAKQLSGIMKGDLQNDDFWKGTVKLSDSRKKQLDAAQSSQMQAGRNAGASAFNAQTAVAAQAAAHGYRATGDAALEAAKSVAQLTAAVDAANAAMGNVSSKDALRTALLDARDFVKENGKVLKASGEIKTGSEKMQRAGIEARAQLVGIGTQAQQAGEKMKAGFAKTKFLDESRSKFISLAKAMGVSGPAAARMATNFGLIDRVALRSADSVSGLNKQIKGLRSKIVEAKANGAKESSPQVQALRTQIAALRDKKVKIQADAAQARAGARAAQAAIDAVHGSTVYVNVIRKDGKELTAGGGKGKKATLRADGGYISGPGGPREDAIPAWLSNGEFVVNAAATSRNLDLLHEINAQRFANGGEVQHFANGGMARKRGGKGKGKKPLSPRQKELAAFKRALEESTKVIDKEKAARDDLYSRRNDYSGRVQSSLTSDQFAAPSSVWNAGGTGSGIFGTLKTDIANANAMKALVGQLHRQGISGDALASIDSLDKAKSVASLGAAGAKTYNSLFNQRAAVTGSAGWQAGQAAYGAQIGVTNKHVASMDAQIKVLNKHIVALNKELKSHPKKTGAAVGKGVDKKAAAGVRKARR